MPFTNEHVNYAEMLYEFVAFFDQDISQNWHIKVSVTAPVGPGTQPDEATGDSAAQAAIDLFAGSSDFTIQEFSGLKRRVVDYDATADE